jgi:hypothetical protein
MKSPQAKIQEDTHFRIMRILQANPDLTQRELAELLHQRPHLQEPGEDAELL